MYETKIEELYDRFIKKDWICLDIGAYDGSHSVKLSKLANKVFSFEACPSNFGG